MNFKNLFIIMLVSAISFVSCKKDDAELVEEKITEITSAFTGVMNAGTFQSTNYKVTVTKVSATEIKIQPEDDNATAFNVKMSLSPINFLNGDKGQVVFTEVGGVFTLTYNLDGEQFDGTK